MGIISLERIDNLIWLGLYSERIYLTIKEFFSCYDKMLDDPNLYKEYCYALQIPMIYENPKDFIDRYVCDPTISDSLLSNLFPAYDNCIVLRNEIDEKSVPEDFTVSSQVPSCGVQVLEGGKIIVE